MTGPIAEFQARQPDDRPGPVLIREWVHAGRPCVIYWGGFSFNGYVLLPEGSPLHPVADAHDIVARAQRESSLPDNSIGYDGLVEMIADVHGSLTYGPDAQGWVGFDTGHGGDDWADEIIDAELTAAGALRRFAGGTWLPGRIADKYGLPARHWTIDELVEETNALAEQLVHADDVLRRVEAILGQR